MSMTVTFFDYTIEAEVTSLPELVGAWIDKIERIHRRRLHHLIVGLDVEWRPNFNSNSAPNPAALLQLCVGHLCLVFQLQYARVIPQSLFDFLGNDNYTFVGVGIDADVQRLWDDYSLDVCNTVDLRDLASARLCEPRLRSVGLTALANEVLDVEYNKPRNITMSNWEKAELSDAQVQYASIDAFLSFEIGRCLNASS